MTTESHRLLILGDDEIEDLYGFLCGIFRYRFGMLDTNRASTALHQKIGALPLPLPQAKGKIVGTLRQDPQEVNNGIDLHFPLVARCTRWHCST